MQVKKDIDLTSTDVLDPNKGDTIDTYPGIQASTKPVAETPGEKETNDASEQTINKKQPFGAGGSGYTDKS